MSISQIRGRPTPELRAFCARVQQTYAAHKIRGRIRPGEAGEAEAQAELERLYDEIRCIERTIFSHPVGSLEAVIERFEVLRFWLLPSDDLNGPEAHDLESEDGVMRSAAHLYVALSAFLEGDGRSVI